MLIERGPIGLAFAVLLLACEPPTIATGRPSAPTGPGAPSYADAGSGRGTPTPNPPDPEGPDAGAPRVPDAGPPPPPPYPSGPYGVERGSTMEDYTFTLPDGNTTSWGEIRNRPGVEAILWTSGAGWCSSCIDEVPELKSIHERYSSQGVVVVESLYEDENRSRATPDFAAEWKRYFTIDYAVVVEPNPPYADYGTIPLTWLIDTDTMEVVFFEYGSSGIRSAIDSVLSR